MSAYMYPIKIDRRFQKIAYIDSVDLTGDMFTLADLEKYVARGENFYFEIEEDDDITSIHLRINRVRSETMAEYEKRIAIEESYMKNYEEFQRTGRIPKN